MKSTRNKTITLTDEEKAKYLEKCVTLSEFCDTMADCTVKGDVFKVAKKLKKESVDLLIVDPPYNMNKNFGGYKFGKKSDDEYAKFTRGWIEALIPALRKTASIYVCCDWKSGMIIGNILAEYFVVRSRISWQREKGRGAKNNWKNGMEDIWYCVLSDDFTFNLDRVKIRRKVLAPYKENGVAKDWFVTERGKFRDTCPSNFWDDVTVPYWSMSENTPHPTQKPEKLIAKLILASSNEGDIVLDPFAGSGTTAVVAKKLNRKFIAIEQNKDYCALTQKRLEMANEDASIQGYDGVFMERNSR